MTREQAEKKIVKKIKEIEKIARKYSHNRNDNLSISILEHGSMQIQSTEPLLDWNPNI